MTTNSSEYMRLYRAKKRRDFAAGKVDPEHGKENTYTLYGCRCKRCVAAHDAYKLERNAKVDQQDQYARHTRPWRHQTPPGSGRNAHMRWTQPEVEVAVDRQPNGEYTHTAPEAAKLLGRTISAVINRRHVEAKRQGGA